MKLVAVFGSTALAVLLGVSIPVYAQQDEPHPQEEKRAEPDGKAAHEQERQDDKHADQDKENRQADHQANQDREKDNRRGEAQDQSARQDRQDDRHDHQAEGRKGRQGGHIPDDRFRANFGRQHTFAIGQPVIVEGSPRFQYGGYWFVIAQPWPVGWAYTDVVYVDYIDGEYFLLSPVHPGVQIAINVIL